VSDDVQYNMSFVLLHIFFMKRTQWEWVMIKREGLLVERRRRRKVEGAWSSSRSSSALCWSRRNSLTLSLHDDALAVSASGGSRGSLLQYSGVASDIIPVLSFSMMFSFAFFPTIQVLFQYYKGCNHPPLQYREGERLIYIIMLMYVTHVP
jgi:hypothetical protein